MLDIFSTSAFSVTSLTDAIQSFKFVPRRINSLGLFTTTGVRTSSVAIEELGGLLSLVSPSPRGGPGETETKIRRKVRSFLVPHFERNDGVMAEEVQGIRAFGSETQLETVQGVVADRMQVHADAFDYTEEYARIGAIKGLITYADGSTLNLFTEFDVTQQTEVDFDLDNASPAAGALRKKSQSVVETMEDALEGVPFSGVAALVSRSFWADLIAHPEVRDTYLGYNAAAELRGAVPDDSFEFGGIRWLKYRNGPDTFVPADKAYLFPLGVPNLFRTYYAPADYVETVNTIGQRMYAKQYTMQNGKGIHLDMQMNSLSLCTRPRVLVAARRT